ncbi:GntR family transcriptional regulator [Streptomyces sp. NBC_01214]|uniref:GntR family transcriptional regulator n=1 Tax=Streptomyces sp. NBC_01214 TaxID=2903777 RepID=UPI00225A68CD|nr:GntR family transcriptional regulator [Streptomyces sp. NBC_01214]MCX4808207.1 GntR family transcriptional regulator [Streptomyces sp. NBC_01214]
MPSPSRGGGQAAMPKYQWIAAALRRDLDRAAHTPGGRLPSERSLAARYQVNRQTIRAALQYLREDGLVVTGRRGTRPAVPALAAVSVVPAKEPSAGPAHIRSWVTFVTVPPSLGAFLGMAGGDRTVVHHHRERGPAGETLRDAVTYISPGAVARSPELTALRNRAATATARGEDLTPLHRWLDRAATAGRVAETLTMTRVTHPQAVAPASAPVCGLTVRRTLHDSSGRLLAVTDLAFPTWDRLTFHRDRRDRATTGFRIT